MRSNVPVDRRSVLACVATVVTMQLGGGVHSEPAASEPDGPGTRPDDASVTPEGRYPATVDRIVDGDHVVVLVEARGEVVAQYDVGRSALPTVREGERVVVTVTDGRLTAVRTESGMRREVGRAEPTAADW